MRDNKRALQTNEKFKHGLFDCCYDRSTCCYVCFCGSCAVADLSLIIDPCCIESKKARWWLVELGQASLTAVLLLSLFIATVLSIDAGTYHYNSAYYGMNGFFAPIGAISVYIIYAASTNIAQRIGYRTEECSCGCFCEYTCCLVCKVVQIANQLDVDKQWTQSRETVELITEINRHAMFKKSLCRVKNPALDAYESQIGSHV